MIYSIPFPIPTTPYPASPIPEKINASHPPKYNARRSTRKSAAATTMTIPKTVLTKPAVTAPIAGSDVGLCVPVPPMPIEPASVTGNGSGRPSSAPETPSVLGGGLGSLTAQPSCQCAGVHERGTYGTEQNAKLILEYQ